MSEEKPLHCIHGFKTECPYCEIDRLKAELEQTRVQLAGCGVAAMCNTRESMAKQMCKPTDYGYSASYQDVLNAVNREIHLRETLEETQRQLAEARAENERIGSVLGLQEYTKHIRQEAIKECLEFIDPITQIHVKRHFGLEG